MKNMKRVLSLVTVFAMVMSVSAFAVQWQYDEIMASDDWENDWNSADSIQGAIDASQSEDKIQEANVESSAATVQITETDECDGDEFYVQDAAITLDLNDQKIEGLGIYVGVGDRAGFDGSGQQSSLTITGDGEITSAMVQVGQGSTNSTGTLTIESGTINAADFGLLTENGSVINVAGGEVIGCVVVDTGATVNVSGGSLSSTDGTNAIQVNNGNVNITGGTISALYETISVSGSDSSVSITGGTIDQDVTGWLNTDAYGQDADGTVYSIADRQAEEAARQAAEAEAARLAALANDFTPDFDFSVDADTTPTTETTAPVTETIEEEATPLAALPEEFTSEDVATLAVDLGLAETIEEYVPETVAEHSAVAAVVESLTAGDDNADAATILADAGINEGDEVSREQFATVIYALATAQGYDVTARADLSEKFTDAEAVSAFAQEALEWAVEAGIYQGDDKGQLNPKDTLTYEQLLLIVSRYLAVISAQ